MFILRPSVLFAQSWEWAMQGTYNVTGSCVNYETVTDSMGNIYVTGRFSGSVIFGKDTLVNTNPWSSVYIVKYDRNRNEKWARQSSVGSQIYLAWGTSVAADGAGNVYLAGTFGDTITFGPYMLLSATRYNVFLVKYDSSGNVIHAVSGTVKYYLDEGYAYSITTDKKGFVYMTGELYDTLRFDTNVLTAYSSSIYLVKFDSSENVVWAKCAKTPHMFTVDNGSAVGIDKAGNVYVTGNYSDTIIFDSDTLASKAAYNVFLVKFDSSGKVIWAKTDEAPSQFCQAHCYSEAIDNAGNVYTTGYFHDTVNFGTHKLISTLGSLGDIYLIKYDSAGNIIWVKQSSCTKTSLYQEAYSVAIDKYNDVFVTGGFYDTIQFGGIRLVSDSSYPAFLFQLDTYGNALCAKVINCAYIGRSWVTQSWVDSGVIFGSNLVKYQYLVFGPDTVAQSQGGGVPFFAEWKPCGNSIINSSESLPEKNSISVFPNPNNGEFIIQSSVASKQSLVEVYDVMGQLVYKDILRSAQDDNLIELTNQPNGVYFYWILDNKQQLIGEGKIVIEK